jgi:hypothetical protein
VLGFPIRISTDRSLVGSSPWLFAATHVLHRLQAPRHPPLALCSLENHKDARARSEILKKLVLLKSETTNGAPRKGRFFIVTLGAVPPENGTERLSKPSGPGDAGRSLGLVEASFDDAVINVGVRGT